MRQVHMTGDQYFKEVLDGYDRRMIAGGKIPSGELTPHRVIRSADYVVRHTVTQAAPNSAKSVVTKMGWIFISTGILAEYDGPYTASVPSIRVRQEDVGDGVLSSGSYGSPALPVADFNYQEIRNGYGPGPASKFLTEPRDFLRVFGESGIIHTNARMAPGDTISRNIDIIVTGWEIKL